MDATRLPCNLLHTHARTQVKINMSTATPAVAATPQTYLSLISRSLQAGVRGSLKTQDVPTSSRVIIIYKSYLNSTPHLTARKRHLHILDEAAWRSRWKDLDFNSEISPVRPPVLPSRQPRSESTSNHSSIFMLSKANQLPISFQRATAASWL